MLNMYINIKKKKLENILLVFVNIYPLKPQWSKNLTVFAPFE